MPSWDDDVPRWDHFDALLNDCSDTEDDGDKVDWNAISQAEAGQHLADLLLQLRHEGSISSKQCCVIAFWAQKSGSVGPASSFSLRPDAQSGHYQRKIDKVLSENIAEDGSVYQLCLPMNRRSDASRVVEPHPVLPVHERLWEEISGSPDIKQQLRDMVDQDLLPASYWSHPLVVSHAGTDPVHPVALYIDGVPTHRHDGVIAVYAFSLVSRIRHLVAALRKQDICKCGCRGWCSVYVLQLWLLWCANAMACGRWPDRRHDQKAFFDESDSVRAAFAGSDAPAICAVMFLKGDLMEYCTTWGLPSTATYLYGCPF
ncbi:MAG: hypothetical protein GWQ05_07400 [Verrucomicrobiaceae bacterium]|nr:hypothetical protein [Verrucomicrobiaceae bacterium]